MQFGEGSAELLEKAGENSADAQQGNQLLAAWHISSVNKILSTLKKS